jgi:predicted RNase H-like HicB family nuclease
LEFEVPLFSPGTYPNYTFFFSGESAHLLLQAVIQFNRLALAVQTQCFAQQVKSQGGMMMVQLEPVDSSMLAATGYDPDTRTLVVLFNSGKAYQYYDVPQEDYEALMAASSKGKYMHAHVLGYYPYSIFRGWDRTEARPRLPTRIRHLKVVVEKTSSGYQAYPPGLQGVISGEGETYEDALVDVRSAILNHIERSGPEIFERSPKLLEVFSAEVSIYP